MPVNFPPAPVYPTAYDNDSTLFLVYNTTETVITADSPPWSEEIDIKPVRASEDEIWADNGFATISGELLYYDSVEKNSAGHVNKLKNCVRNLGGSQTQFNASGKDIRGFIIAEHHNQLVEAIINVEEFIGDEDCLLQDAVTCCLAEVEANPAECPDDGNCPIIDFAVTDVTQDDDNCVGTVISYTINVDGIITRFNLDFGDGTNTASTDDGTHTFSPGANIDPVITASNDFCEVILTPLGIPVITSDPPPPGAPGAFPFTPGGPLQDDPFIFPVPPISIPNISITPIECPSIDISLPPLVEPCFQLDPFGAPNITIPTSIDIDVPDTINIVPPIPNIITIQPPIQSTISVIDNIPTEISVIDDIPTEISLVDDLPATLSLVDNLANISLIVPTIPALSVTWGTPPTISACITLQCPPAPSMAMAMAPFAPLWDQEDFSWDDEDQFVKQSTDKEEFTTKPAHPTPNTSVTPVSPPSIPTIEASVDFDADLLGIPSEINIIPPVIPDVKVKHNIPTQIDINCPTIPDKISFVGIEDIKDGIELIIPDTLEVPINATSLPKSIPIDWGNSPRSLSVMVPNIPPISIEHNIPTTISVEGIPPIIAVEGIPDSIAVTGFPESLKVDPVEVIVKLDMQNLVTNKDEEGHHCVAIVPCPKT